MKTILLSVVTVLMISFSFQKQSEIKTENNLPGNIFTKLNCPNPPSFVSLIKNEVKKEVSNQNVNDIDQSWYLQAIENIKQSEYDITYCDELGAYQSPNRANSIRFIYQKDGFTAVTRDALRETSNVKRETENQWRIDFKMLNVNSELSMVNSEFNVDGNKAHIENESIRIDYTNTKEGMRQDFIVKNKPEGDGKLRLNLSADTKLKMIVGADALMFKDKKGIDKMKYSALKCWDANGNALRAYFEKPPCRYSTSPLSQRGDQGGLTNSKFSIVVNDEDAVYPVTIDPLSASPNWTAESDQISAVYGKSVSTAGDVNGDGFSDVIIGAPNYDNGQTDEGRVYVYYGTATGLPATANWTAESNLATASFGGSVSTSGDVNGDGYSDIIVGSSRYTSGQNNEGAAFEWFGSASGLNLGVNGTPSNCDWRAEGNEISANMGFSVSTAGDVNGDGYSDVIVGIPYKDGGYSDEGAAYVYYGYLVGTVNNATWTAGAFGGANANFGCSVSTAGDVNGDGFSDIIIGSPNFENGIQNDEGYAFVWLGSSTGLGANGTFANSDWSAYADQDSAKLGFSVSTAGDVNGDGYSDVIIGAPEYDNGSADEGIVLLYLGSSADLGTNGNPTNADWIGESNQVSANFGYSLGVAGDVNGDGYSDVVIGSPLYDNTLADEGGVYLFYGSSADLGADGTPVNAGFKYYSGQLNAHIGTSIFTAGDVNGDGFSDVIAGADLYDNGQADEGRAYLFNGAPTGLSLTENWTSEESDQIDANLGFSVSSAGDVNGDDYADVIIGAPYYDFGGANKGIVFVYHGSATGLPASTISYEPGPQTNANFGSSVSTAGDFNGDGYSDVIVGMSNYDGGNTDEGRVSIYRGSSSGLFTTSEIFITEGNQDSAYFGANVSTAGDVNGDGYSDVIIGAYGYDNGETDEGKVYVYYGSPTGNAGTPWTAEGNQTGANFGDAVSTAGDVNGDGYSDILIGASRYDNGQTDEGSAFVYYGSATGLSSTPDWTAESDEASGRMGFSVSTAGDVNGDGYPDVIVGAVLYDNGQANEGGIFVWNGSSTGLGANGTPGNADWSAESNQTTAQLGYSVSNAGDVNGDGYSDIIAGARFYDNGQNNEGKIFLWYGSSAGLGVNGTPGNADWTFESDQADANLGISVAGAGDINGDGYSDVIAGAPYYDNGQSNEGLVYAFYGNGGTGLKSTLQQFGATTSIVCSSGGLTSVSGKANLQLFGRSMYGRADGRMAYEIKANGVPFSGSPITNSVSSTGLTTLTDLGSSGSDQLATALGLLNTKEYKWRARVQYRPSNNPFQKNGPWKYYTNYISNPFGCFKAIDYDSTAPAVTFTNLADTSSLSNRTLNNVVITDASGVNGVSGTRPRIYYKKKTGSNVFIDNTSATIGWKYAQASGATSPFSFTINNSLLSGGVFYGDTIQYFITAQDVRGIGPSNVGITTGTFNAEQFSVALASNAFPITGTIKTYTFTDNAAPVISYSNITDTASLSNRAFNNVVITDSSGIQGSAGFRPRVYYKRKTDANTFNDNTNATAGWKYSTASGSTSPFSFTINYSRLNSSIAENDTVQYFVVAQDKYTPPFVSINSGTFAASPSSVDLTSEAFPITGTIKSYKILQEPKNLYLTALIQGFYDAGSDFMISDTVTVYLRNSSSPYVIIETSKVLLGLGAVLMNGTGKDASGSSPGFGVCTFLNALNGVPYYIQISHRNSIETWSSTAQSFVSSQLFYYFSTSANQAYGDNMIQVDSSPDQFAMYSGDVNQDGAIDLADVTDIENDAFNFATGYLVTDVNGDGGVDLADQTIADNNAFNFVAKVTP